MSNNGNNNNKSQQANVVGQPVAVPVAATQPVPAPVVTTPDPVKEAVVLCLKLLLRAATMGTVARANEEPIKLALESLK